MKKDISIIRGDTFAFNFIINDVLGGAYLSAKTTTDKTDTKYVFQKTLNDGIELIGQEAGQYTYAVRIAPEDTNNLDTGKYYYDLQLEINDDVYTPLMGKINITYDITREV